MDELLAQVGLGPLPCRGHLVERNRKSQATNHGVRRHTRLGRNRNLQEILNDHYTWRTADAVDKLGVTGSSPVPPISAPVAIAVPHG